MNSTKLRRIFIILEGFLLSLVHTLAMRQHFPGMLCQNILVTSIASSQYYIHHLCTVCKNDVSEK